MPQKEHMYKDSIPRATATGTGMLRFTSLKGVRKKGVPIRREEEMKEARRLLNDP